MSQKDQTEDVRSQIAEAGGSVLQVGRDYIQHIGVNFNRGNWLAVIISLIPALLISYVVWTGIKVTLHTLGYPLHQFLGSANLSQGQVNIFNADISGVTGTAFIAASASQPGQHVSLIISDIPLADYEQGLVKIGSGSGSAGSVTIVDGNSSKTYQLNTNGTDLTLKLSAYPTEKGEFARGMLRGIVTDGVTRRTLSLSLVVPVQ